MKSMAKKKTDNEIAMAVKPKARPVENMKKLFEEAKDPNIMGYNESLIEFKEDEDKALDNPRNLF